MHGAEYRGKAAHRVQGEDGNVLILGIGFIVVILVLLTVLITLGNLYLHKKQLAAVADATALYVSDRLVDESYFVAQDYIDLEPGSSTSGEVQQRISGQLEAEARAFARQSARLKGIDALNLTGTITEGGTSRLAASARFPLILNLSALNGRHPRALEVTLEGLSAAITIE